MTARHVIEPALRTGASVRLSLVSKHSPPVPAQIFYCSAADGPDICIIKIGAQDLAVYGIQESDIPVLSCRVLGSQERISAMGYPIGDNNTLFNVPGQIVGGIGEFFLYPAVLSAAEGMSGGPVYDVDGRVIGVLKGVAAGYTYFTPIAQVRSQLGNASIACM